MITAFLTTWITGKVMAWAGGSILVFVVTWILNKIPSAEIREDIYKFFFEIGAWVSGFFNSWKYTKAIWEKLLEPWIIGFVDMLFVAVMDGLFAGLRSDNKRQIKID